MHALLLIAHGSRREASNKEIVALASTLQRIAASRFGLVLPAFLELAKPDIRTGVDQCVDAGATTIVAVPYFLAAGRHVASDIPGELEKAQRKHPQVELRQSDYLGTHQSLPELLLALALDQTDTESKPGSVQANG